MSGAGPARKSGVTSGSSSDGVGGRTSQVGVLMSCPFKEWLKEKRKVRTAPGGVGLGKGWGKRGPGDLENGWGSFKARVQWRLVATCL